MSGQFSINPSSPTFHSNGLFRKDKDVRFVKDKSCVKVVRMEGQPWRDM
jgi:hypothetical protein